MTTHGTWRETIEAVALTILGAAAGEITGRFLLHGMSPAAMNCLRIGAALPGIGMLVVCMVRRRASMMPWCIRLAFAAAVMAAYWLVAVFSLSDGDARAFADLPLDVVFRIWWPAGTTMGLLTVMAVPNS